MLVRRLAVLLVSIASLVALAPAAQAAPRFVGLGDSYAAGPLIPVQLPPFGCLKSSNNYAQLSQLRLAFPEFQDASCSGAETEDMTQAQGVTPGPNPPQFDRLTKNTRLATLLIGGNDIGFSSIAEDCFTAEPRSGTFCKDKYVVNGVDEVSRRIAETAPKVAAVLQGIKSRSPKAKILTLNYAAIFPHEGPGCHPQMPIAEGDVPWLREKQEELNGMIASEAAAAGATLVDWYEASRGHDACKLPGIRWVEPVVPVNAAAPVHPNLGGMLGASELVVAAAR